MSSISHFVPRPRGAALAALSATVILAGRAGATIDFTYTADDAIHIITPDGQVYANIHCVIENTGTSADMYDILRTRIELPADWVTSICIGGLDGLLTNGGRGGCQAPFVDSLYAGPPPCGFPSCSGPSGLGLEPGQVDTVSCFITPSGAEGSGYVTFTLRSVEDPDVRRTLVLGCVTNGVDVLLVDDDGGAPLETYYQAAIPAGLEVGTWRCAADGLSAADLLTFPVAVWFTGAAVPTLAASDRAAITGYLVGGGRLLLSGQDIAYDLCDPGSPNYSPASLAWYESTLHTRYVSNQAASSSLNGVAGDPISDGLALAIQGGDGANNQTDPDVIRPLTGAGTCWTYAAAGSPTGVTRVVGGGSRAVDLAFGFEAISTASNRALAMTRMLDWLGASRIAVGDVGVEEVPAGFALEPARPNPFNPSAGIAFELQGAAAVRLRILDAAGRVVRVLADEALPAGRHARVWDGRDAAGREMPSGVYVAELAVDGRGSERVKLSLVR